MAINFKGLSKQSEAEQELNRPKERSSKSYENDIEALQLKIDRLENELKAYKDWASKYQKVVNNGTVVIVDNIAEFCREHKLNRTSMYALLNGQQKEYKGWRLA